MAWVKFTPGRLLVVDSDDGQVNLHQSSAWTLFDGDSRKSDADQSFDSSSQEWGSFTKGETLYFYSDNGNVQQIGKFEGTFTSGTHTFYVISWEDPDYGTYYGLAGIGDTATGAPNNQGLLNAWTAGKGLEGLTDPPHVVPCYMPGTLVATPAGERLVEELAAGDMVSTAMGDAVPVKWIGRSVVSTRFGPAGRLMPVRFAAGSLGGGQQPLLPHSDLTVTADHAMLVDGVLCEAGALVNGTTITRVPLSEFDESYTVYHVETDAHEIILANGAPAETFVDNASRKAFDNYAEFEALYGENPPEMVELPHPRAANARQLPKRIRIRFGLAGAGDSGQAA